MQHLPFIPCHFDIFIFNNILVYQESCPLVNITKCFSSFSLRESHTKSEMIYDSLFILHYEFIYGEKENCKGIFFTAGSVMIV